MTSSISIRLVSVFLTSVLAILSFAAIACGGSGNDSQPSTDSSDNSASGSESSKAEEATSAPVLAPTAPTDLSSSTETHESGLVVKEITLDAGEYGGKMGLLIFNAGDKECYGPTINLALLLEDKSVTGNMGIIGEPLPSGAEKLLNQRYVGIGVVEAVVTHLGCDHTSVSDTGSPSRHTTPIPSKE